MTRKIARKVLNFELAMIKVPLCVFDDRVGDRLPPHSPVRRAVRRATDTIDAVAEATRPRSGTHPTRMAQAPHEHEHVPPAANGQRANHEAPKAKQPRAAKKPTMKAAKPSG